MFPFTEFVESAPTLPKVAAIAKWKFRDKFVNKTNFSACQRQPYLVQWDFGDNMRSNGSDIVELFGFAPDDTSPEAIDNLRRAKCPFLGLQCSKTNHDKSVVYGTCSVTGSTTLGVRDEVIICPKRLYAQNYKIFDNVTNLVWGNLPVIIGGDLDTLRQRAAQHAECIVAFGHNSGKEITLSSNGKLSMDWVLQRYKYSGGDLIAMDFVGIEIQSIDTTGNYRDNFSAYSSLKNGSAPRMIPNSQHGLNWANVHKRLIPQIIRKGNIYSASTRCRGFFFILPEVVYRKFREILGNMDEEHYCSKKTLTILTYDLGIPVVRGQIRDIKHTATKHHLLHNIALAFSINTDPDAPGVLDENLNQIL
jgi:hypothetical protein